MKNGTGMEKNGHTKPEPITTGLTKLTSLIKAEFQKSIGEMTKAVYDRLETYNDSINILTRKMASLEKNQLVVKTKLETSVNIIKFLFGGGCLLTIINIIVFIIISMKG